MELRQLKYFVTVAETLNFSEAAKQLCITQSTLSQQIKQLEQELGSELLTRTSHTVVLTEAGATLYPQALATVRQAQECRDRICDLNDMAAGTLSIGVTYSFGPILTETLSAFMKKYPKIRLEIIYKPMAELMELLRRREVDFVLAFKPSKAVDGVESHMLFQNYLAAVVGEHHPLASKEKVTLAELAAYDLALPARGLQARNAFEALPGVDMQPWRIRIELNEVTLLLKLLRSGMMASVLSEASIHNEKGVCAVPVDVPDNEMAGCVHTLKNSYRKRSMIEFIRLLSESLAVKERQNAWI